MHLPDFLEAYRSSCDQYLQQERIREVNFSGPTYQIEVLDRKTNEALWVFLQLENEGVKDVFCSCEDSTQKGACEHMAAACYFVFLRQKIPLHLRFQESFWHALFFGMLKKCGAKNPKITKDPTSGAYAIQAYNGVHLFSVDAHREMLEKLKVFFEEKAVETEETSIKFSNLSEEELEFWRQGRPSMQLRFELSFLSDLAKFFFLHQAKGFPYQVSFQEESADQVEYILPSQLHVSLKNLEFTAPLSQDDLIELVPTLETVKSNLPLFQEQTLTTESIEYLPEKATFVIHRSSQEIPKKLTSGISLGAFRYVPKFGFYAQTHEVKAVERISDPKSVNKLLNQSLELVANLLPKYTFRTEFQEFKYQISIDSKLDLHIEAFLFEPHDLIKPTSRYFGDWAYVEGRGFFRTEALKFPCVSMDIHKNEISQFIHQHRSWMNNFKGYEVHVAKMQEEFSYRVDEVGNLWFQASLKKPLWTKNDIDLGDWIYRKGEGFFLKEAYEEKHPLPIDKPIPRHIVADFIRRHFDQLHGVFHFFMLECPVLHTGLNIRLKKKGLIEIAPEYEWINEKDKIGSIFYDEFVFVRQKGFYRLPASFRPLHYMREISSQDTTHWNAFFLELLPKLKREFTCKIDSRLERASELALVVKADEARLAEPKLHEWDVDLYFRAKSGDVNLPDLITSMKKGERFLPTNAGVIDLSEDRYHFLKTLHQKKSETLKNGFQLSAIDLFRLRAYEPLTIVADLERKEIFDRLLQLTPQDPPEYPALQCTLRPYQKNGVEWLWFLYRNALSGILCDDMGVGKTHQAMGLIASIRKWKEDQKKPSLFLVVCPTSLIYHWEEKIQRFLPNFRIKAYVGQTRTLDDFPDQYDVLLTTYGIWRNESRKFRNYFFEVAFFDELQIAKNHVSQIYAALLECKSHMKIGLTGTPIENQLRELKALFDLVLPGYMPQDSDFREFFVRPIEKEESIERRGLLARFVKPFVLRRRKQDVLPDLPEKTEDLCYAELIGEQKSLYKTVGSQQAFPLIQQLKDETNPIPYMHIFALLTSLKQICNHPAAYLKDVENYERYESGKWDAFVELLEEAEESEQKVVVFSQYLAMLDIIEAYLKKKGVPYAQIRGQTRSRGEEIVRFNNDPKCRLFLGSLQAAGLGIDLTAGSVVIHYDRWWNAARENQATDRVHRIGQTRGVQVFKLLTKATIEEKINLMIQRKKNLLEDIVAFDDHQIMKRFTRQEIISLLEGLGQDV